MNNKNSNRCSLIIFKILFNILLVQILFSILIYIGSVNSSLSLLIIITRVVEFIIAAMIGVYIEKKNYIFTYNQKEAKIYLGISVILLLVYLLGYFLKIPFNFLYSLLNKTGLYSDGVIEVAWYKKYFSVLLEELFVRNMIFNFIISLIAFYGQNLLAKDIDNR